MSALGDKFNLIVTEKEQREQLLSAKSCIIRMRKSQNLELDKFNKIKTTGAFDTIDADVKTFLLQCETAYKNLKATLDANAEFVEIIDGEEPIE